MNACVNFPNTQLTIPFKDCHSAAETVNDQLTMNQRPTAAPARDALKRASTIQPRRMRSNTGHNDSLMQPTLRNKEAAVRHLALLNEQLLRTESIRTDEPLSSEEPSDNDNGDLISVPSHRPQSEIDARLALGRQIDQPTDHVGLVGSLVRRRYHSTSFELNSDVSTKSTGLSPRQMAHMTIDCGTASSNEMSPRRHAAARAARCQRQLEIVQQFLHGKECNYSWTKFQQCIHAGLDDNTREQFWITQAMTDQSCLLPQIDKVMDSAKLPQHVYDDIVKDIYRTMPSAAAVDPTFINSLYRGLVTHAVLRPDIGYVQGMNMLWANIIVSVSNPSKRLVVAEHLVRTVLPYYFTTDLLGALIDARVLHYYLVRRCEKLERQMALRFGRNGKQDTDSVKVMLQRMTSTHFPDLFNTLLSGDQRKRLWDQIMLRGAVAMFEFMLRLFIYARDMRLGRQADNWAEFCAELEEHTRQLDTIDDIMATKIPVGRIIQEDFVARRCSATRIVFDELNKSMQ